jgi:hypothetical protein
MRSGSGSGIARWLGPLVFYPGVLAPHALAAGRRRLPPHGEGLGDGSPRVGRGRTQVPLLDVGSADAPGLQPGRPALSALRRADAVDRHD